ncbi:MAG: hypothetical protein WBA12_12255, partial [Catalinimonas sp.]
LLKLRAGWGATGNAEIGFYPDATALATPTQSGYNINGDEGQYLPGATLLNSLGNRSVRWETVRSLNVGIDANFLFDKIQTTFDYFERNSTDLLTEIPISDNLGLWSGNASPTVNLGEVSNRGFEASVSYRSYEKEVKYSVSGNYTYLVNNVVNLNGGPPIAQTWTLTAEGRAIGAFYGLVTDGIFQNEGEVAAHADQSDISQGEAVVPGDIRYVDINGDGRVTLAGDRAWIGNPIPRHSLGFNFDANWKGFDVLVFGQGVIDLDVQNNIRRRLALPNNLPGESLQATNKLNDASDYWTPQNTGASLPRLAINANNNTALSDFFLEDASYFRLRNVQIGYSLQENLLNTLGASRVRVYAGVQNLLTLTNYSGLDPEIGGGNLSTGIDSGSYPQARTYLFGVNIEL